MFLLFFFAKFIWTWQEGRLYKERCIHPCFLRDHQCLELVVCSMISLQMKLLSPQKNTEPAFKRVQSVFFRARRKPSVHYDGRCSLRYEKRRPPDVFALFNNCVSSKHITFSRVPGHAHIMRLPQTKRMKCQTQIAEEMPIPLEESTNPRNGEEQLYSKDSCEALGFFVDSFVPSKRCLSTEGICVLVRNCYNQKRIAIAIAQKGTSLLMLHTKTLTIRPTSQFGRIIF